MRRMAWFLLPWLLAAAEPPVERMTQSTVYVAIVQQLVGTDKQRTANGSGFVIGDRQVVTNWHVCCQQEDVPEGVQIQTTLYIASGKDRSAWLPARVVWSSIDKDLAVLQTDKPLGRPVVSFRERRQLREGQTVWAVGFPGASTRIADAESNYIPTITQGIISKFMTGHTTPTTKSTRLIQSTAAINPGNSGGPMFDECGSVVGINRAKALRQVVTADGKVTRVTEADGINWTVQTDELFPELKQLNVAYSVVSSACVVGSASAVSNWMVMMQVVTVMIAIGAIFVALNRRAREAVVRVTTRRRAPEPPPMPMPKPVAPAVSPTLRGLAGFYAGASIPLESRPWIFGRDHQVANLVFPDEMGQISKRHCQLSLDSQSGAVTLEDLWSSNGTFLDSGEKIEPGHPRTLRAGERFYLASRDNLFEIGMGA